MNKYKILLFILVILQFVGQNSFSMGENSNNFDKLSKEKKLFGQRSVKFSIK